MKIIKKIILAILLLIITLFAVQNSETLTIKFLKWSMTLPASLLIILVYVFGMTTGSLLTSFIKKLTHESKAVHENIENHEL